MDMRVFENALSTMPESVHTVFLGGMGEPLCHEDIVYMVRRAAMRSKRVEVLTNGTLLTREMSAALLGAGLDMLWISLDSVDAGMYESIRQKSSFSLLRQNISDFNTERQKKGHPASFGLSFVAMKSNVAQLGGLVKFAHENGISDINISNMMPTTLESQNDSLCKAIINLKVGAENSDDTVKVIDGRVFTLKENKQHYPRINLPILDSRIDAVKEGFDNLFTEEFNIVSNWSPYRKMRYCKFINEGTAFVRYDGHVSPCLALLHSGTTVIENRERTVWHHSFGNAGQQSLREIWDSKEYVRFRKRVRDFDFSPCTSCGGCDHREENIDDCFGSGKPSCGACFWSEGVLSCP